MPAASRWQILVTNLSGVVQGEVLNYSDLKVNLPLMRVPTCSFTIKLWNPMATTLLDTDTLIKVYRVDPVLATRKLVFHGPTLLAEENGEKDAQSIAVTATGPFWRLTKRIVPGTELPTGIPRYPASGDEDLGVLAHWILTNVNGAANGNSGIKVGTRTGTFPRGVAALGNLKNAAEAIAELASGLNSFEFEVAPIEPETTGTWPYIGQMNVATAIGFVSRTNALFEYGTSRANLSTYKRSVDRSGMLTKGYIASPTWTETTTTSPLLTTTADTVSTRGLFEDVVPDGGMEDNAIRQALLDEHIAVRKNPRQTLLLTPAVNARPLPFVDYEIGDFVRARAVVRGSVRFDSMFRIWGLTFNVDKNGNESIEVEVSPP